MLTEYMLLKDGANNLQTDAFQLLSDLEQGSNDKDDISCDKNNAG